MLCCLVILRVFISKTNQGILSLDNILVFFFIRKPKTKIWKSYRNIPASLKVPSGFFYFIKNILVFLYCTKARMKRKKVLYVSSVKKTNICAHSCIIENNMNCWFLLGNTLLQKTFTHLMF